MSNSSDTLIPKLDNKFILPSPIQKVNHGLLSKHSINLHVKREDLIHPFVSGNKYRKLKFNLQHAIEKGVDQIITFGGAFSNHIHATSAACKLMHLKSIGIIRGEFDPNNPTLQFAKECGMKLHFINRMSYREKEKSSEAKSILSSYSNHYLIPEGGSNDLAYIGLQELTDEINETDFDVILVSAGTGGTATGILKWLDPSKELWVFSSLKSNYLEKEILDNVDPKNHHQLKFIPDYHFGGYGKSPEPLIHFINSFHTETKIPLDPIYNGKLVNGFFSMLEAGLADHSKSYLWIHTGGLQGIKAYNYMADLKRKVMINA